MNAKRPYVLSNKPLIAALQRRWLNDRAVRERVSLQESWRGCLGLAMLLDRPDDTEYHAGRALLRNDHLTWIALRDVPPGHFPGSGPMHRRGVSYANAAKATLRYGMPCIDLSRADRDAIDFRFFPGARCGDGARQYPAFQGAFGDVLDAEMRTRELEVLVRLSETMTCCAFSRVQAAGRPRRCPRWHRGKSSMNPRGEATAASWMPVPYLAFSAMAAKQLLERLLRRPPHALRHAFCDAVALGVPRVSVYDATYVGRAARAGRGGENVHTFDAVSEGASSRLRVPTSAEVLLREGDSVEAGRPWCRLTTATQGVGEAAPTRTLANASGSAASARIDTITDAHLAARPSDLDALPAGRAPLQRIIGRAPGCIHFTDRPLVGHLANRRIS